MCNNVVSLLKHCSINKCIIRPHNIVRRVFHPCIRFNSLACKSVLRNLKVDLGAPYTSYFLSFSSKRFLYSLFSFPITSLSPSFSISSSPLSATSLSCPSRPITLILSISSRHPALTIASLLFSRPSYPPNLTPIPRPNLPFSPPPPPHPLSRRHVRQEHSARA
jgi:hypothetical protein